MDRRISLPTRSLSSPLLSSPSFVGGASRAIHHLRGRSLCHSPARRSRDAKPRRAHAGRRKGEAGRYDIACEALISSLKKRLFTHSLWRPHLFPLIENACESCEKRAIQERGLFAFRMHFKPLFRLHFGRNATPSRRFRWLRPSLD